jgi:hypothetical protein
MTIGECTAKTCSFKINTAQYGHTCGADGIMKLSDETHAEYKKNYNNGITDFHVGLIFNLLPDNSINLQLSDNTDRSFICGMNAYVHGVWKN